MSRSGGKAPSKENYIAQNEYEIQRLRTIEANKTRMKTLGIKRIAASLTSLVDSSKVKKSKEKCNASLEKDSDYVPDENEEVEYEKETHNVTSNKKVKINENKEGDRRSNLIPPMSIARLL
ncbi:uncharacterized protein LOC110700232 [Chenopodium quinoa]|uniref:uncharacterized protein LOC110700232 n=1 Tax=Chenopodium quinoa TaxID=63459 RepID=UPI000B78BBC1|nr:uncharacterized protein LOC110700232 [Chenopodium quinoa]XP_021733437.1 uncharacterized protein LOC110700232 [Chenopodium quinoa]